MKDTDLPTRRGEAAQLQPSRPGDMSAIVRHDAGAPAFEVCPPAHVRLPLVVASPHSGRDYPVEFLAATQIPLPVLRRAEDAFVDELLASAPGLGAPLLRARLPRSYVDLNREPFELDPGMFDGGTPPQTNSRSARVAAGLGVIPRVAATGEAIYRRRLQAAEIPLRLARAYHPYHAALRRLVAEVRAGFGVVALLDCHSMPSAAWPGDTERRARVDFVLGDNHGTACAPALVDAVGAWLRRQGFRVSLNQPYAGGFTTQTYGAPAAGVHALQIEINRALYMDELRVLPGNGFAALQLVLADLLAMIGELALAQLQIRQAAE